MSQSTSLPWISGVKGNIGDRVSVLGGKAINLRWLALNQFNVPSFIVVNSHFFDDTYPPLISELMSNISSDLDSDALNAQLAQVRDRIIATEFTTEFNDTLASEVNSMRRSGATFFAVRSSVIDEDSSIASFAGQMDSFLYCKSDDDIRLAIGKCFASAFSTRAIQYRMQHGLPFDNIKGAVIIQEMIDPDVSGVLFSANPSTGRRSEMVISACYGVGEGVVSGECDTDQFETDLLGAITSSHIVKKVEKIGIDGKKASGTSVISVDNDLQDQPCLNKTQIRDLVTTCRRIAGLKHHPQDIEWAISGDQLYILQTRDITALPVVKSGAQRIVWDNSNIEESYAGVTTPLTFSFARSAYKIAYESMAFLMGISRSRIDGFQDAFWNLLGLIKGRVYYNINNWYVGLSVLPSFSQNKADMERMMGLQDPVDFVQSRELSKREKIMMLPSMFLILAKFVYQFSKMDRLTTEFRAMFDNVYQSFDRKTLHEKEAYELVQMIDSFDEKLLKRWQTPLINDMFVMMMNGRMNRIVSSVDPELSSQVNNLLAGEGEIESTEPTKYLLRLADKIRSDETLNHAVSTLNNDECLTYLQANAPEYYEDVMIYIERYGDRCTGELKLESITLRQDASFIFAVLKNFLKKDDFSIATLEQKEKALRKQAEDRVFSMIKEKKGQRALNKCKRILTKLRLAVKSRENMRLMRTRMFGMYRDTYLQIGRQFVLLNIIEEQRDIFYLTIQEVRDYFFGALVQHDFKSLIQCRKNEYQQYAKEDVAHHFQTNGYVYHHTSYAYSGKMNLDVDDKTVFKGIPCYPGRVSKKVKVITDPNDEVDLEGDILCAVRTDPGWGPLFPSAGGILVERGSTLSHSAVVARELGIPAVVGIHGITKRLKTGDMITLDGETGEVHIHDEKNLDI